MLIVNGPSDQTGCYQPIVQQNTQEHQKEKIYKKHNEEVRTRIYTHMIRQPLVDNKTQQP